MRTSSILVGCGLALVLLLLPAGEAGAFGRPNLRMGIHPIVAAPVFRPQPRILRPFTQFNGGINPLAFGRGYMTPFQRPSILGGQFTGMSFGYPFAGYGFSPYNRFGSGFAPGGIGFSPFVSAYYPGYAGYGMGFSPYTTYGSYAGYNPYASYGGYNPYAGSGFYGGYNPYSFYTNPYSGYINPYAGGYYGYPAAAPVIPTGYSSPGYNPYGGY